MLTPAHAGSDQDDRSVVGHAAYDLDDLVDAICEGEARIAAIHPWRYAHAARLGREVTCSATADADLPIGSARAPSALLR
ncbi:MAG: hypothetical protein RL385_410 [Pseudomonadota bacterium]|jgi:hypothetical protein